MKQMILVALLGLLSFGAGAQCYSGGRGYRRAQRYWAPQYQGYADRGRGGNVYYRNNGEGYRNERGYRGGRQGWGAQGNDMRGGRGGDNRGGYSQRNGYNQQAPSQNNYNQNGYNQSGGNGQGGQNNYGNGGGRRR